MAHQRADILNITLAQVRPSEWDAEIKMERLVLVVLLLVLGCGLAHSRILTKCELINLIRNQAQQEQKIGNITIAKSEYKLQEFHQRHRDS